MRKPKIWSAKTDRDLGKVEILCERTRTRPNETVNERETQSQTYRQTDRERDGARYKEMLNCTAASLGIIGGPVK